MARLLSISLLLTAALLGGCTVAPLAFEPSTRLSSDERADSDRQLIVTIREAAATQAAPLPGAPARAYGDSARYQPSSYARRIADQLARDYGLAWMADWRIDVLGVHCVVFRVPDTRVRSAIIKILESDSRVESVQAMHGFTTSTRPGTPAFSYNDPYFELQQHVETLRVPEAHEWSRGRRVRVAIIDTGVHIDHPELAGRVSLARNFVDDDAAAFKRDTHGTAIAGVIAAAVNNGLGIVGIAPEVELLALKACWHEAPGQPAMCNTLTLAEALAFAIERKAAIINLSLTGPPDPLLSRLLDVALRRGIVVVGADAPTSRPNNAFPSSVSGVLAVADADEPRSVHARIAAPGHEILTLTPSGRYDYSSGASLSSAMVSGVVALLLEQSRDLSPSEVMELLERTALQPALNASARVVNACHALASILSAVECGAEVEHVAIHSARKRL